MTQIQHLKMFFFFKFLSMDILPGVEDFQVVLPTNQKNGTALPLVLEAGRADGDDMFDGC